MRQVLPALPALLIALGVPQVHAGAPGVPMPEPPGQHTDTPASPLDLAPDTVRLARYTTVRAAADPQRMSPLATVVRVSVPADIADVGSALRYVLLRTGHRLGESDAAAAHLFGLPLPQSHRDLGPAPVRDLLAVLVGEAYVVEDDPIDRTVVVHLSRVYAAPEELPAGAGDAVSVARALPVVPPDAPELTRDDADGQETDHE